MSTEGKIRLAIRGWKNGALAFCDFVEADEAQIETLLPKLGETHALRLVDSPHMIEIEFLDEPDPETRFMRFGTDPRGMVQPLEIDFNKIDP